MYIIVKIVLVGIGATFAMDIWSFFLGLLNIKSLDYRLVGRWIANIPNGQFIHKSIMNVPPVKKELMIGWVSHYIIGISFAFFIVLIYGKDWFDHPRLYPALVIGILTLAAPFFLMQPAFGLGIAGSNIPETNILRLKSFMAHFIYGVGLYLSALLVKYASFYLHETLY